MKSCLTFLGLLLFTLASGQSDAVRTSQFNLQNGTALEGYDPVSYFTNKPQEGESGFSYTYKGITYLFAGKLNLEKFKVSPEKYEPAYGGWCAYAMGSTGEKVNVDPETYKIVEGTLYLFYNSWGNNTLTKWNNNERKLKESANANWKQIVK